MACYRGEKILDLVLTNLHRSLLSFSFLKMLYHILLELNTVGR